MRQVVKYEQKLELIGNEKFKIEVICNSKMYAKNIACIE